MNNKYGSQQLPSGWTWATIGEIANPERIRVKPQNYLTLPYIGMEDVESESMRLLGTRPAKEMKSTSEYFHANDVLYGRLRPYLNKVYRPDFDGLCSAEFIVFREVPYLESKYLQYFLNQWSFVAFINRQNTGDRPRVKFSQMADYAFPLPPRFEQKRIVLEIEKQFSRLDAAVTNLKRVQANLERYKASVLKAACEGRLVPQDPDDEPAEQLLERILAERRHKWEEQEWSKLIEKAKKKATQASRKQAGRPARISDLEPEEWQELPKGVYGKYLPENDKWKEKYKEPERPDTSELPELPAGWVWATVEQCSALVTDGDHNPPKRVVSGIPHLTAKHVAGWKLSLEDSTFISIDDFARVRRRYDPEPGDVIITCVGTLGRTAIVPENFVFSADRNLAVVRLQNEGFLPEFLQIVLNSPVFQRLLAGGSGSTAQPHLYLKDIRGLTVPVPPTGEQARIVREVEYRLTVLSAVEAQIKDNGSRAKNLRQAVLEQAFSGRLVPQNPSDEPATALLARLSDGYHRRSRRAKKPGDSDEAHQPKIL